MRELNAGRSGATFVGGRKRKVERWMDERRWRRYKKYMLAITAGSRKRREYIQEPKGDPKWREVMEGAKVFV